MSAARRIAWFFYWCAVALVQLFSITLLKLAAARLQLAFVGSLLAIWISVVAGVWVIGWLALLIRQPGRPWRMGCRLLLVAAAALLLLALTLFIFPLLQSANPANERLNMAFNPLLGAAVLAVIGFHLPGWFRPPAVLRAPAAAPTR
ncbi:MAG: hypothetical protein ACYC6L_02710 [Anaerolineae bacterium]